MRIEFKEKLIVTVVDKLLIGLLIFLASFLANYSLEKYKIEESAKTTNAYELVQKAGELWESAYKYESAVRDLDNIKEMNSLFKNILKIDEDKETIKLIPQKEEEIKRLLAEYKQLVDKNRFYVHDEVIAPISQYVGFAKSIYDENERKRLVRKMGIKYDENFDNQAIEEMKKTMNSLRFNSNSMLSHTLNVQR